MSDSKDGTSSSIPVITDKDELLKYGLVRAAIPAEIDSQKWASELSQVTPLIMTAEDGEYSFYRNIMEEPGFPFDALLKESSEIGKAISEHFGIKTDEIRLDDAFCIHYNTSQDDTSGAKHMDPSDITVNMCLESDNVLGSQVLFYGTQPLAGVTSENVENNTNFKFLVPQQQGFATIHWGHHPHETMPLARGRRTNVVLTYCYKDTRRSDVQMRTCYETTSSSPSCNAV